MPGEVNDKAVANIKDKFILLAEGIIVLILLLLANQQFLMLEGYFPANNFWLNMFLTGFAVLLGVIEAKKAAEIDSSIIIIIVINLLPLGALIWITSLNYSKGLLLIVESIIIVVYIVAYRLAASLTQRVEYLRLDFIKLGKWKEEQEGLNFKRHGEILHDVKIRLIVIDSLAAISWIVSEEIKLNLILSGVVMLILQFLLWQVLVFTIKGFNWFLKGFKIDFKVFKRSISWSLIIIIIISSSALFFPVQSGAKITDWIANKLSNWHKRGTRQLNTDLTQDSGFLDRRAQVTKEINVKSSPELEWLVNLIYVFSVILGGLFLMILSILIISVLKGRIKKVKEIPVVIVQNFKYFINSFFKLCKGWLGLFKSGSRKIKEFIPEIKKRIQETKNEFSTSSEQHSKQYHQEVWQLLFRLLTVLEKRGFKKTKSETVEEYFNSLKMELPTLKKDLVWVKKIMDRAIYSQEILSYQNKDRLKQLVDKFEKQKL